MARPIGYAGALASVCRLLVDDVRVDEPINTVGQGIAPSGGERPHRRRPPFHSFRSSVVSLRRFAPAPHPAHPFVSVHRLWNGRCSPASVAGLSPPPTTVEVAPVCGSRVSPSRALCVGLVVRRRRRPVAVHFIGGFAPVSRFRGRVGVGAAWNSNRGRRPTQSLF